MQNFLKSILAGIAISLGGVCYLSCESHLIGAFLFSLGLFMIYLFHWNLYTGKACYVIDNSAAYLKIVAIAFIGNFVGTVSVGLVLQYTKLVHLIPIAQEVATAKLSNTNTSGFILGIFCGLLMYVAVIGYSTVNDGVGKYLILIMPIVAFTISGFEHVVANMFYFTMANAWSASTFIYLMFVGLGNLVGCSFIPFANKFGKLAH